MSVTYTIPGHCQEPISIEVVKARWSAANASTPGLLEVSWDGLVVGVCGGDVAPEGRTEWNDVVEMTRLIAHHGGLIINGGGSTGVMVASAKAFPQSTVGIVTEQTTANPYGRKLVVGHRLTRTALLTKLPTTVFYEGGVATIEEWARVLQEIKHAVNRDSLPPTLFLHEYWKEAFDALWHIRAIPKRVMDQVQFFVTATEVVEKLTNGSVDS